MEAAPQSDPHWLLEILDSMSEAVCRFSPDGTILYANVAYGKLMGMEPAELVGLPYEPMVHRDDLARVKAEVALLSPKRPELVIENRIVLTSGEIRWTQWTNRGFFDPQGKLIECQSVGRDVTDRAKAERALREGHRRARFLAEASELLTSSLDYEDTLSRVARLAVPALADLSLVTIFGRDSAFERTSVAHVDPEIEEALDRSYRAVSSREALSAGERDLLSRLRRGEPILYEQCSVEEVEALGVAGERLELFRAQSPLSFVGVPVAARGKTLGVMTFVSSAAHSGRRYDESDLELAADLGRRAGLAMDNARLYAELAEIDRRKDEFLAKLGHELRNPLAAITTALDTIGSAVDAATRERALAVGQRQAHHQARLVEDLLNVSRLMRGRIQLQRQRVELRSAIEALVETYRPLLIERGQRLVVELPNASTHASVDPVRFEQIVGNLLDNASGQTRPGGAIEISLARDGEVARVQVVDEGVGLSAEDLERVFEPFVQLASDQDAGSAGIGLGLTLVRQLVELHGGRVTARSDGPGSGAEFAFEVPLDSTAAPEEEVAASAMPPPRRLLVVDDNMDAADVLGDLLAAWGHDVRVAYSGISALQTVREVSIDIAIVDVGMPEMNGYELAQALRALPECPRALVALTGYAQPSDVKAAHSAGFDRHAAKPIDADNLAKMLEAL